MSEPPTMWLILPIAAVCAWQSYRLARLRRMTNGLVGSKTEYVMYLGFAPAALAMLNAETLPWLSSAIEWSRMHVLVLLVTGTMLTEVSFRITRLLGAYRLTRAAETSEDVAELGRACSALEAMGCYDIAIAGYRRLESHSSDRSRIQTAMAALFGIRRRFLEAEKYARLAAASNPLNPLAHAYLSLALLEQGRHSEAQSSRANAERLGVDFRIFSVHRLRSGGAR
jgi:tetratricopeptide (TPR) repeat protein